MPLDPAELERLRATVAPVEANLLSLIDARPKQPGFITGGELPGLYLETFGTALDPEPLTGQTDLKAMLNRRNIFPTVGVRGSEKKGGWVIYRVALSAGKQPATEGGRQCPPSLVKLQDNILELLHRAANPKEKGRPAHHSLDAGRLADNYGAELKQRFNWRDFGMPSLRALMEACPKLGIVMKGKDGGSGKHIMHVVARQADGRISDKARDPFIPHVADPAVRKRKHDGDRQSATRSEVAPPASATASATISHTASAAVKEVAAKEGGVAAEHDDDDDAAKAARKAAKRAKKAAEAGLSMDDFEAARTEATAKRKEKKALGKEKKASWKAENTQL